MIRISTEDIKIGQKEQFYIDTIKGLQSSPKWMSSKYFYDEKGDQIFQQIMAAEEYYLTNCEMEIFSQQAEDISSAIVLDGSPFDLIELGAGDATKSMHLLKRLLEQGRSFTYFPIDISSHVIDELQNILPQKLPGLQIKGLNGDYFEMVKEATRLSSNRKVLLFMGANIGNMNPEEAASFCAALKNELNEGDMLMIGFDLKKNPRQILAAYSDKGGITKTFNLNLLNRMNRELNADFQLQNFDHYANYDPETGSCKSYLISLIDQEVTIGEARIYFHKNEYIFMEISQKYNLHQIKSMMHAAGFKQEKNFFDTKEWFVDSLWSVS